MPKAREELRRGVRSLIEVTSREMDVLTGEASPPAPSTDESSAGASHPAGEQTAPPAQVFPARDDRPILRLVRDPTARTVPAPTPAEAPAPMPPAAPAPVAPTVPVPAATPSRPAAAPVPAPAPDLVAVHAKKGVCAAYHVNHACWEVPDAYCNQALHVCMLRDCPVYHLHQEELERRFAAKFAHLW